jgi:putative transposase
MSASKYNPQQHHRRSIRLQGYDYAQEGLYFITICCQNRAHRFGEIVNGVMALNEYGLIAYDEWAKLSDRFQNIELDVFQIMPNHMHGIICIGNSVGASIVDGQNANAENNIRAGVGDWAEASPARTDDYKNAGNVCDRDNLNDDNWAGDNLNDDNWAGASPAPTRYTIGNIVGAYKSLVANACLNVYKSKNETMGKLWQRNYWEHIIRNEPSYARISEYILNNPKNWNKDSFYQ